MSEVSKVSQEEIDEALEMKGYMKKLSPNILKGWQKRYFILCKAEKTFYLAYFHSHEDNKPAGNLDVHDILSVSKFQDRMLKIIYPQREFQLKAKSAEIRDQWVKSIQTLINHVEISQGPKLNKSESFSGKQWNKFTDDSLSSISLDKEIKLMKDQRNSSELSGGSNTSSKRNSFIKQDKKLQRSNSVKSNISIDSNLAASPSKKGGKENILEEEEVYNMIGLKEYFSHYDEEFVNNRIMFGYMNKRSQGKIKYFMKRFYLLVSSKSLNPNYIDEEFLQEKDIPTWLELDTLYYYKIEKKNDIGQPKEVVDMKECIEVFEKDMSISKEEGFTFRMNTGDRIFNYMTETSFDRKNWITALRESANTARELKGNVKINKNIDKIIFTFDQKDPNGQPYALQDRRSRLREKIDEDLFHLQSKAFHNGESPENFLEFYQFLESIKKEMINIYVACNSKQTKRTDIIQEYIDYLHSEVMAKMLTKYWDKNHEKFQTSDYIQLANFLLQYAVDLQEYFKDARLEQGSNLLLKTYRLTSLEGPQEVVKGIVKFEKQNKNSTSTEEGLQTSTTPQDLFKLLNTAFDMAISICNFKQIGICMAEYGSEILQYYQSLINEVLENTDLDISQEICMCNNSIQFASLTNQFVTRLKEDTKLSDQECEQYFSPVVIKQGFLSISDEAHFLIFRKLFSNINTYFNKKFFLDFELEESLQQILENGIQYLRVLHDRFSRKIWKELLECLTLFYFQCMILSCSKAKKDHLEQFIDKIDDDADFLREAFQDHVWESSLEQSLKPFKVMSDFLQASDLSIQEPCRDLREFFGKQFTQKTIKTIFSIRHDLDKINRNQLIECCFDAFQVADKQASELDFRQSSRFRDDDNFNIELGDDGNEDDDPISNMLKNQNDDDDESEQSKSGAVYRKTMNLDSNTDDIELPFDNIKQQEDKKNKEKQEDLIDQGWIELRKGSQNFFTKYFFRIKNGFLYWYPNDRAPLCENKIPIDKIESEILTVDKKQTFTIVYESKKKKVKSIKFKCESPEVRDKWVKSLKQKMLEESQQFMKQAEKSQIIKMEGKQPLFKDYYEIKLQKKREEAEKEKALKLKELQEYEKIKLVKEQEALEKQAQKEKQQNGSSPTQPNSMQSPTKQPSSQQNQKSTGKKIQFEVSLDNQSAQMISPTKKGRVNQSNGENRIEKSLQPVEVESPNYSNQNQQLSCCDKFKIFLGLKKPPPKNGLNQQLI